MEDPINRSPLVVIGSGGHASSLTEAIQALGLSIEAFIDERATEQRELLGIPVMSSLSSFLKSRTTQFVIAIGDNFTRESVTKRLLEHVGLDRLPQLIHPDASVAASATLGAGSVVLQGAIIGARAALGIGVIANSGSIVEHECSVGDFASLAPGSVLGGRAIVGDRSAISLGATIRHGVRIGIDTVVGASSYVNTDIPDRVVAYGLPATVIRGRMPSDDYLS